MRPLAPDAFQEPEAQEPGAHPSPGSNEAPRATVSGALSPTRKRAGKGLIDTPAAGQKSWGMRWALGLVALGMALSAYVFPPGDWARLARAVPHDHYDELSFVWIWHRLGEKLLSGRLAGLWDGGALYPFRESLLLSETTPLLAATYRAWLALLGAPLAAYNATVATSFSVTFLAALWVAGRWLRPAPACLAALLFAFGLPRLAHLGHAHLLPHFGPPLAFYLIVRLERRPGPWPALGLGLVLSLQAYASMTLGIVTAIGCLPWAAYRLLRARRDRLRLGWAVVSGAVFLVTIWPLAGEYRSLRERLGFKRTARDAIAFSANPKSYFVVPRSHPYAGWLVDGILGGENGQRQEKCLFVGFAALALAAIGAASLRRRISREAWLLGCGGVFFVFWLSMGTNGGLYQLLHPVVPLLKGFRAPARLGLLWLFGVAAMAGLGLERLMEAGRKRRRALVLATALVAWALWEAHPRDRLVDVPRDGEKVALFLRGERASAVAFYPLDFGRRDALQLYWSLVHEKPIVNGYSGFVPQPTRDLAESLLKWADGTRPEGLSELARGDVSHLVIARDAETAHTRALKSIYEDDHFRVCRLGMK